MSNYHILDGDLNGDATVYTVIFHFPVPDEDNSAGVNLRIALSQDTEWPKTSKVPWITTEQAQLTSGEVFEWRPYAFTRIPSNTTLQDRTILDAKFTSLAATIQDKLRNRYKYWGMDRNVP